MPPPAPPSVPRLPALAILGLSLLAAPAASPAMTGTFSNVVDSTNAVPGQSGNFLGFGAPSVSGGNVTFTGSYNGGNNGNNSGIYTGTVAGTGVSRIADITTAVPGQTGSFTAFGPAPSLDGGTAGFLGYYNGLNGNGIYTGTVGGTGSGRVADATTAVPGQGGTFSGFSDPSVNGGNVAFLGSYNGSGGSGVYTGVVGTTGASRVADLSTPVPGQSGTFTTFGSPAVSGPNVALLGFYNGRAGNGIYTGTVGTDGISRVADLTTTVPGQGGNFTRLDAPTVSGGTVVFRGVYAGGQGIYTGTVGAVGINRILDLSTPEPGRGGTFNSFNNVLSLSDDNVAFLGDYNASSGTGIFLALGDGSLIDVIDVGDPLFGSTVTSLRISQFSLDGNEIAFNYQLANGVTGEAVGVVPEPGARALLLLGGAGLLGGCLRRWPRRREDPGS